MKRVLSLAIIMLFTPGLLFAKNAKSAVEKEERLRQIDKSLFLAGASDEMVLKIGMVDCILYALKKNSDILIKRVEPSLKADDVKVARADFEPTFSGGYNIEDNTELAGNVLQGATVFNSLDINFNAAVEGKVITGTKYFIDFANERYKSDSTYQIFNPYYTVTPQVTIIQPLLKGFGILVNRANIIIAQNNKLQSDQSFKDTAINSISKAKTAYYNYSFSLDSYAIDKLALERTLDLLTINKARYAKGLISSVDLLETEAASAQKEKAVVSAEAAVKKTEDDLKVVTNLVDDPDTWNANIILLNRPEFKKEKVELLECIRNAFNSRPDYESAKLDLKNRDIKIAVAKNELLPTIDLTGTYGLNGLEGTYDKALKNVNTNYIDWIAGVKVTIPWGSADRAKYDQRKLEKVQALLSFKKLEHDIILDVRDKVRQVKVQERQVDVARISLEKETENYNAQKERYAAGQVSTHDMLDYQDKLAKAELDFAKAMIDYNLALINLDKSEGLTLAKNDIKLEEQK